MPAFLVSALAAEGADATAALDFSDALTTALTNVSTTFGKYAIIAIPIALAIWGAPKAIRIVMKFFSSLTH